MRLNICGLPVQFIMKDEFWDTLSDMPRFRPFIESKTVQNQRKEEEHALTIEVCENFDILLPPLEYELKPYGFAHEKEQVIAWNLLNSKGMIRMAPMWQKAFIYGSPLELSLCIEQYLQLGYTSYLTTKQGLFMHGAIIEYEGEGIIITAQSGGGKSTLADLCQKYFGAKIINGDKAMIRIVDGKVMVFGSPWAGSSNIYCNKELILKGVIVLEKSDQNKISELSIREAITKAGQRIYYPYWNEALLEQSIETLEQLFLKVPIYELKCKPEEEAARLVRNVVYGNKEE